MKSSRSTRFAKLWDTLRSSYWFVPISVTVVMILLALALTRFDTVYELPEGTLYGLVHIGNQDGARAILTTIASSMITVVSLTFSITIVALTLAASQFGSRLLYNFMRDRINQWVLGIFVGTFIYSLIVLRMVAPEWNVEFIPHIAINFAMLMAIVGVLILIHFIHHVSESMQADQVINNVRTELKQVIERYFPEPAQALHHDLRKPPPDLRDRNAFAVCIESGGVLQAIDHDCLVALAQDYNAVIKTHYRPGDFVISGTTIADWYGPVDDIDTLPKQITETFIFGRGRTLIQDIEFAIHQLVEIAVRALSPGVNDPITAMRCIDELGEALAMMMRRELPQRLCYDSEGDVRVILRQSDFKGLVNAAFDQIRQYGSDDVDVTIKCLEVIAEILPQAAKQEQRDALVRQARLIYTAAEAKPILDEDRRDIQERYQVILNCKK